MPDQHDGTSGRIERLVRQAYVVVTFERLWPPAVMAASVVAVFLTLGWLGVWVAAPRPVRIGGVAGLVAAAVAAAILGWRAARPSRAELLGRLDRDSGRPHRPVSTVEDRLANQGDDPTTQALWAVHRERADAALRAVRVSGPSPRMADRDPYALRALALLALVGAGFIVGPHREGLVAAAFDWRGATTPGPAFRIDAWIDPPGYTGKPPVVLFGRDAASQPSPHAITVPAHSTVVIRSSGAGDLAVQTAGALAAEPAKASPVTAPPATDRGTDRASTAMPKTPPAVAERRFVLDGDAHLGISHDGAELGAFDLHAIPDQPPTIALVGEPRATDRGGLTLAYRIDDDYGVTGADAAFSDPVLEDQTVSRPLVPAPKLALGLPPTPGGVGEAQTTGALSDHPWAGAEVSAVLTTRDEGGNAGTSRPVRMVLPTRHFSNPLARALVEQRRALVLDPDHRDGVETAIEALMIGPDRFDTSNAVYLGLNTARRRLQDARTDADLVSLADYLWQMALDIEDGDRTQAQRDLKSAAQALRDAMQRGAPPDEIKRLTDALRQEMDKVLAEVGQRNHRAAATDPRAKVITEQGLQAMTRRLQDMAQSGDMSGAQRMLDQLQSMLETLGTAQDDGAGQSSREANLQMNELDRMTRDQQDLRDRTFRQGRQKDPADPAAPDGQQGTDQDQADASDPSGSGQPRTDGGQDIDGLEGQQQALSGRLQALQRSLRDLGLKGEPGLDDAAQAMKDAEGALGQGQADNRRAVDAQGRALAGLQKGAQGLSQQLADLQGQQGDTGQGQQDGQGGQGQGSARAYGADPLGRQRDGHSMESRGAGIGEGVAARAARVLQELRRRLGDPTRPREEQDYLERLLRRY